MKKHLVNAIKQIIFFAVPIKKLDQRLNLTCVTWRLLLFKKKSPVNRHSSSQTTSLGTWLLGGQVGLYLSPIFPH